MAPLLLPAYLPTNSRHWTKHISLADRGVRSCLNTLQELTLLEAGTLILFTISAISLQKPLDLKSTLTSIVLLKTPQNPYRNGKMMSIEIETLARITWIGVGATAILDVWNFVQRRVGMHLAALLAAHMV